MLKPKWYRPGKEPAQNKVTIANSSTVVAGNIPLPPHPVATFAMRKAASEGLIFLDNRLKEPGLVSKYFPQAEGEDAVEYQQRARSFIAAPITSSIIRRISGSLHRKSKITAEDQRHQETWDYVAAGVPNWALWSRNLNTIAMASGHLLVVFRTAPIVDGEIITGYRLEFDTWDGRFIWRDGDRIGYEYYLDGGVRKPVVSGSLPHDFAKTWKRVEITDTHFISQDLSGFREFPHGFGFVPAVLFSNIDVENENYSKTYVDRFDDLVVKVNQTLSQADYSIHVLQNVWETNQEAPNPDDPLLITPGRINHTGHDGYLRQVVRELELTPEWEEVARLRSMIAEAGQVPFWFTGLENLSEFPSGVALERMIEPYIELMDLVRSGFNISMRELAVKAIRGQTMLEGLSDPVNVEVDRHSDENVIPADVDSEIARLDAAQDRNRITEEEATQRIRLLLGFDDDEGVEVE